MIKGLLKRVIGVFKGFAFLLWVQISIITVFIKQEIEKERSELYGT